MHQEIKREDIVKEREAIDKQWCEINAKIEEMTAELRAQLEKLKEASLILIEKCPFHHFTKAYEQHFTKAYEQCEYCGAISFPA